MVAFGAIADGTSSVRWHAVSMHHVVDFLRRYLRERWHVLRHLQIKASSACWYCLKNGALQSRWTPTAWSRLWSRAGPVESQHVDPRLSGGCRSAVRGMAFAAELKVCASVQRYRSTQSLGPPIRASARNCSSFDDNDAVSVGARDIGWLGLWLPDVGAPTRRDSRLSRW